VINFDGMKAEASGNKYPMLPEGPYIAEVKGVHIEGQAPNQTLILRLEVTEGEYKDYFTKRYQNDSQSGGQYAAKYKGDYRLRIPHPQSNSQYPDSDKRRFNDAIYRLEKSNPDYHFSGDENSMKGLKVGINMQTCTFNDNPYTQIGRLEIVDDIRKGLVKAMPPRKPRYSQDYVGTQNPVPAAGGFTPVEDVEIPF